MRNLFTALVLRRSRFGPAHSQLEPLPLLVSVLDDLQKSVVFNVAPKNFPTAFLALQTTTTIALRVIFDESLAQLAGGRHVELKGGIDVYPDLQRATAIRAFNLPFHGEFLAQSKYLAASAVKVI